MDNPAPSVDRIGAWPLNDAELRLLTPLLRTKLVDAARGWLRTPYKHCAALKGSGVDCAMLLVEVFKEVGYLPQSYDPRPYPPAWFLHRNEERYLAHLIPCARQIEEADALPGDIAMYRFGRTVSHGALIVDAELMIHACRDSRCVELRERRSIANRFDSCWTLF